MNKKKLIFALIVGILIGLLIENNFIINLKNQIKILTIYLVLLSVVLEFLHLIIPHRTFQWSDIFGNLMGVLVVILIKNLINKYGIFKK